MTPAKKANASHFTQAQVARMVGVQPQSVTTRIRNGKLKTVDVEGSDMVPRSEVDRWIAERGKRAAALLGSAS